MSADLLEFSYYVLLMFNAVLQARGADQTLSTRVQVIANILIGIFLAFHVDSSHVVKFIAAGVGAQVLNSFISAAVRFGNNPNLTKRRE